MEEALLLDDWSKRMLYEIAKRSNKSQSETANTIIKFAFECYLHYGFECEEFKKYTDWLSKQPL